MTSQLDSFAIREEHGTEYGVANDLGGLDVRIRLSHWLQCDDAIIPRAWVVCAGVIVSGITRPHLSSIHLLLLHIQNPKGGGGIILVGCQLVNFESSPSWT
jgi:hypothetical protein